MIVYVKLMHKQSECLLFAEAVPCLYDIKSIKIERYFRRILPKRKVSLDIKRKIGIINVEVFYEK